MLRTALTRVVAASLAALIPFAVAAARVSNPYGEATTATEADGVELSVAISAAYQLPNADPFDVDVICVDGSGMYKWLLTLDSAGRAALNLMGRWRSASHYDIDADVSPGVSFALFLPPPLIHPDDRLLISIADDSISVFGPLFSVSVDAYRGQPLRMDILRVTLARDAEGHIGITAQNLTHVPLFVSLGALILGLAPTPDWIPDTTPDIRWLPDPVLSSELLVIGADETVVAVLPSPTIPTASATAYRGAMSSIYSGMDDAFPGDYLAIGFPVAWGVSWSYLPVAVP